MAIPAYAWDGAPSPHDGSHLVVVRPSKWRLAQGPRFQPSLATADKESPFGQTVPGNQPLSAQLTVRHAGTYDLWLYVKQTGKAGAPLEVRLLRGDQEAMAGRASHDAGEPMRGGPAGFKAYREKAEMNVPGGVDAAVDLTGDGGDELKNDIIDDMASDEEKEQRRWINSWRLDKVNPRAPGYWWKVAGAQLEPGDYELQTKAGTGAGNGTAVSAALLTTYTKLNYPFAGDIDAPPANYVRFRIDSLGGKKNLVIDLDFLIHHRPFRTSAKAAPEGFPKDPAKALPHTHTGFTRWYRLNDIEHISPNGYFTMTIGVPPEARGISQFATFPHDDGVRYEFDWNGLDEKYLAVGTPQDGFVYTGRDLSRHHYQYAQEATGSQIFPLMRGDGLTLTNSWGNARGAAIDYLVKTVRLLGFNQASSNDPIKNSAIYGWRSFSAITTPGSLPFDDAETEKIMDEAFKAPANRPGSDNIVRVQLADEPIEANTMEYSAPQWRFEGDEKESSKNRSALNRPLKGDEGNVELDGSKEEEHKADADGDAPEVAGSDQPVQGRARWRDVTGSSDLNTRRVDFDDIVFEGEFSGEWVGFRAGLDNPHDPKQGVFWRIGDLSRKTKYNVEYGREGGDRPVQLIRKAADLARGKATPFKLVLEHGKAALFVNGAIMWQHDGLPEKSGLGIFGPEKSVYSLRLRPIREDEHIDVTASTLLSDKLDGVGVGDGIEVDARDFEEAPKKLGAESRADFKQFVETEMVEAGGIPAAQVGFRKWCAGKGVTPALFGKKNWAEVRMLTLTSLIENPSDRRRYYWSRRYSSYLTPHMYGLAAAALRKNAPNKNVRGYVGLSGHSLYMHQQWLPMDTMQLAAENEALMPGVSDWMSLGSWRWDSLQSVAYSVAPMNAGARRYGADWGKEPISYPMMHQVGPDVFRSYTMLSNQVKHISYWNFGPMYASTEGSWSDNPRNYVNAHYITNRISQVDDILPNARMRPSRVAMLYSLSNEYWDPTASYADKRALFLGLSHDYYQPDVVTEDQISAGALQHYDALYVVDTAVTASAQEKIAQWVQNGGLLWACAGAASLNEYGEPFDLLQRIAGLKRVSGQRDYKPSSDQVAQFPNRPPDDYLAPVEGEKAIKPHSVFRRGDLIDVQWEGARVRARYRDGVAAFGDKAVGKGRVVYLGHRGGITYSLNSMHPRGVQTIWIDVPRAPLTAPVLEAKVDRELVISEPTIMSQPMSTADGTVLLIYNMKPVGSTNVRIGLKEPAKPASVQGFAPRGIQLQDIPFEYSEGRVWFTLPTLESHGNGTIVRVRRTPVPADPRPAELKAKTITQLKSGDPAAISAALWLVGLNPQWNLGSEIEPFVGYDSWLVRLAAVEAAWRLDRKADTTRIYEALQKEKDAHVRCEMVYALAHLGHPKAGQLTLENLSDPLDYVRRQAMRAVIEVLEREPPNNAPPSVAVRKLAADAAQIARRNDIPNDHWGTGRGWKERLMALHDPKSIVDEAALVTRAMETAGKTSVSDPHSPWDADDDTFANAIAGSDSLYNEFVRQGLPGSKALVLGVARRRRSDSLAQALLAMVGKTDEAYAGAFNNALLFQRDKGLTRQVFARRAELPAASAAFVPVALESTFAANLGTSMPAWERWLAANSSNA